LPARRLMLSFVTTALTFAPSITLAVPRGAVMAQAISHVPVVKSTAINMAVSARVIKGMDWQEMSILLPHEAYRLMITPLPRFKIDTVEKASMFKKWWETLFVPIIAEHHDIEEKLYFPWIEEKVPLPPKLAAGHIELNEQMAAIAAQTEAALSGDVIAEGKKLEDLLSTFTTFMLDHLAEEEDAIPGALRSSGYTAEDDKATVGKIMANIGDAASLILPLFKDAIDTAGGVGPIPSGDAWVLGLPPSLQEAMGLWYKTYLANNKAVVSKLSKPIGVAEKLVRFVKAGL